MESKALGREWLQFTNNILLPLGALLSIIRIIVLIGNADNLPAGSVGGQVLSALISLGLSAALFVGLKQLKPWAWYLMLGMLVLTPIGAAISRMPGNTGNQGVTVALLIIGFLVWTLPNAIYFYRRRSWFGIATDLLMNPQDPKRPVKAPQTHSAPPPIPTRATSRLSQSPVPQAQPAETLASTENRAAYAKALKECDDPTAGRDDALWALSLAKSGGNNDQARAAYISLRVHELSVATLRQDLSTASTAMDYERMESALTQLRPLLPDWPSDLQHAEGCASAIRKIKQRQVAVAEATQQLTKDHPVTTLVRYLVPPLTISDKWDQDIRDLALLVNANIENVQRTVIERVYQTIQTEMQGIFARLKHRSEGSCEPVVSDKLIEYIPKDSPEDKRIVTLAATISGYLKTMFSAACSNSNYEEALWFAERWHEWRDCAETMEALDKARNCSSAIKSLETIPDQLSAKRFESAISILRRSIAALGPSQKMETDRGVQSLAELLRDVEQLQRASERRKWCLVSGCIVLTLLGVWSITAYVHHVSATKLNRSYREKVVPLLMQHDWPAAQIEYKAIVNASSTLSAQQARENVHTSVLEPQARSGDPRAQVAIGWIYANGFGSPSNLTESVEWYRKAAEKGDAEGQWRLGSCYEHGAGVPLDKVEAVKWYRKAAEQGIAESQCLLGSWYAHGEVVTSNISEAAHWYNKAAEQGVASAQYAIGNLYLSGTGVKKDSGQAVQWFRRGAVQGDAASQNALGECYFKGIGIEKNPTEAFQWFQKSAKQKDPSAQFNLAVCYRDDCGLPTGIVDRYDRADELFLLAAEQGSAPAQVWVGRSYAFGKSWPSKGLEWFRKAAANGNTEAMELIGLLYFRGSGVLADEAEGTRWYYKAASQGDADQKLKIASSFDYLKYYQEALYWYRKSAEQGKTLAQWYLYKLYDNGILVERNHNEANSWYKKACESTDSEDQHIIGRNYLCKDLTLLGVSLKWEENSDALAVKWLRRSAEQGNISGQWYLGACYAKGIGVNTNMIEALGWFRKVYEQEEGKKCFSIYHCLTNYKISAEESAQWLRMVNRDVLK